MENIRRKKFQLWKLFVGKNSNHTNTSMIILVIDALFLAIHNCFKINKYIILN